MLKVEFVCYSSKRADAAKAVVVEADNFDEAAERALKLSGLDRISGAKVLAGDITAEIKAGALRERPIA